MASLLLVDTQCEVLKSMQIDLKEEGFQVSLARNSEEAYRIAAQNAPEAVIIDTLPSFDMKSAVHMLRSFNESIRIAFVSESRETELEVLALDDGADDFIRRPISPQLFVRKIKALLR